MAATAHGHQNIVHEDDLEAVLFAKVRGHVYPGRLDLGKQHLDPFAPVQTLCDVLSKSGPVGQVVGGP
jgi:hypothetical protein